MSMDIVESVLRSANAEAYIEAFQSSNIEAATLLELTETDLQVIGVDDASTQKSILQKASNLQIPREKKIDLIVNKEYAEVVLSQIAHQLHLHYANLSCALTRRDLIVCDVKLRKATETLCDCITSLEGRLNEFEQKYQTSTKKAKGKWNRSLIVVGVSAFTLFILGRLITCRILNS